MSYISDKAVRRANSVGMVPTIRLFDKSLWKKITKKKRISGGEEE
jgi:hypothetical protein